MEECAPASLPAVIDLWTWWLERPTSEVARLATLLSHDETARALRFVLARDARRYIVARASLRIVLGNRLGVPPDELTFDYNEFGKPHLAPRDSTPTPHFNLSHSGPLAMLAICDRFPLGIDVEETKPLKEDIAGYFFSRRERASLKRLPQNDYLNGFYRCWTRKEAFVKAHGSGLAIALDSFDVSVGPRAALNLGRLSGDASERSHWRLYNIRVPAGFQGALSALSDGAPVRLRYHAWQGEDLSLGNIKGSAAHPGCSDHLPHRNDDSQSVWA